MELGGFEHQIVSWLSGFAYHPLELYGLIFLFMMMSGFGLPIPEEIVLVSSGLIAYAGSRPDLYPPPYANAAVVQAYPLAAVCLASVFFSDMLVFMLGRKFGSRIAKSPRFGKYVDPRQNPKLGELRRKYGAWACGIFRFTPGIRFPGHLSCGIMRIPYWKFSLIDGGAALLSVPTQVILVATYGEVMLGYLKQFKIVLFTLLAIGGTAYLGYRLFRWMNSMAPKPIREPKPNLKAANLSAPEKTEEKRVS